MKKYDLYSFILFLSIGIFVLSVGGEMYFSNRISNQIIQKTTLDKAYQMASALKAMRKKYTEEAVSAASNKGGMQVTHDYLNPKYDSLGGAIPLPATLSMQIAKEMSNEDISIELYSPYPFPWRRNERKLSNFQKQAFNQFEKNKNLDDPFYFFNEEEQVLDYAMPDKMVVSSCVQCHNTHPQSPKTDWEIGDVRGAIYLKVPFKQNHLITANTRTTYLFLVLLILSTIGVISVLIIRRNKTKNAIKKLSSTMKNVEKGIMPKDDIEVENYELKGLTTSLNSLIKSYLDTALIAKNIGSGDFNNELKLKSDKDILGKALISMQEKLKASNIDNKKRIWANEGYNIISDLIRLPSDNSNNWYYNIIEFLVNYLDLAQIGIFITETKSENINLVLKASIAFDKRDVINNEVNIENGLIGRCYKEKKPIYLTNLPKNYITVSSALGKSKPKFLGILPVFNNEKVVGILELSSFNILESYQKEFVEKVCNSIAIAVINIKNNNETIQLLQLSQEQTEELRASEEELLQSSEETRIINDKLSNSHRELEKRMIELQLAKSAADAANKSKTRFLANMSHEIRSPLNAISGFSQLLVLLCEKLNIPEEFKENLNHIIIAGQNLSELINNILDLSKIESGKMEVSLEPINIKQLFEGIFHINKANAEKKALNYSYKYNSELPPQIQSDRTKLNQILMNVVNNAIKFTPMGKSVRIEAGTKEKHLIFKVVDQGIGITEDRIEKIFESFEQEDNTITRRFGGTGLGLSITKKMVEMLNGTIWVESEVDVGSTFFIKIPLIKTDEEDHHEKHISINDYHFAEENVVLAIDDIEMNQQLLQGIFSELNLEIHFAGSGKEGIKKIKELDPDLVLMDIHMPEIDGLQATRQIRKIPKFSDLPLIAVSADAFIEQQKEAQQAGFTDYITKPIDFDKLIPLLAKYLKMHSSNGN